MRLGADSRRYELFRCYDDFDCLVKLVTKDDRVIASFDLPFCKVDFVYLLAHYLS